MNSQTVLGKIMTLLSLDSKEVKLTVAKLADGTLVESPTFDVGETLEVIHEDGTKTPAPDGEHLLELRDESDEINRIKLFTEGGIIKERENVEIEAESEEKIEEEMADVSTEEVEALPESGKSDTDVNEQVTLESEPGIAPPRRRSQRPPRALPRSACTAPPARPRPRPRLRTPPPRRSPRRPRCSSARCVARADRRSRRR